MFDRFRFGAAVKRERADGADADANAHATDGVADAEEDAAATTMRTRAKRVKQEPDAETAPAQPSTQGKGAVRKSEAKMSRKWQERWHGICSPCFESVSKCSHVPIKRLRLLVVGHNPSDHAWTSGFSYSNPSNRMWNLLCGSLPPLTWSGVLPANSPVTEQNIMPHVHGVGFTSIGLEPGNDAAAYGKVIMTKWKNDFFRRLREYAQTICKQEHQHDSSEGPCREQHSPMIIAFSGKRQFSWLFSPPLTKTYSFGKQTRLPEEWPQECRHDCEVWVLPSSSGRAAMTTQQRALPYQQLAARVHEIPWTAPQQEEDGLANEATDE